MIGTILRGDRINTWPGLRLPRFGAMLALWHRRAVTRAALRDLPPERLRDLGLTPGEAAAEAARPFWQGRI